MNDPGVKMEVHLIQNFAPSNLNRDDTGQPKSAYFGGFRRARISSQCSKRSARREGPMADLLQLRGAVRTRQLIVEIARRIDQRDDPADETISTVAAVFEAGGLEPEKGKITRILLFLDKDALPKLATVFEDHWADLTKGKKDAKESARDKVGRILFEAVKAPDIALFGRMLEVKSNTPFGGSMPYFWATSLISKGTIIDSLRSSFTSSRPPTSSKLLSPRFSMSEMRVPTLASLSMLVKYGWKNSLAVRPSRMELKTAPKSIAPATYPPWPGINCVV